MVCIKNFGLWTEYATVSTDMCFQIPDEMSFDEAAAIPVTYLTAHVILFNFGNLRPKQSVLVHMAAGRCQHCIPVSGGGGVNIFC